ncbi:hypothetical protein [Cecembia lonarensis]|uniref:Uncharacterized protein n=1 Tax=Cecembia lonarensis (strain CCUG 58316 / KCTC 22772 / LW9) TaxID=1225176 RepID=K1L6A3_CECL9|nr:hypothetical protein [Cecembia lonarensis]EKB47617.1 hypothetical protein B879_03776 [Cecembia lonarensis LW9]
MEKNLAILRVPVPPFAKNLILSKFSEKLVNDRFLDFRKMYKYHLGFAIKSFLEKDLERYVYIPKNPDKDYIEFILPKGYLTYGISEENEKKLSRYFELYAKNDLVILTSVLSFLPGVSRTQAIRTAFEYYNITDEEYDQTHFRRYFDRYGKSFIGDHWYKTRRQFTVHLKKFFVDFLNQKHKGKTAILRSIKQYKNEIDQEYR